MAGLIEPCFTLISDQISTRVSTLTIIPSCSLTPHGSFTHSNKTEIRAKCLIVSYQLEIGN